MLFSLFSQQKIFNSTEIDTSCLNLEFGIILLHFYIHFCVLNFQIQSFSNAIFYFFLALPPASCNSTHHSISMSLKVIPKCMVNFHMQWRIDRECHTRHRTQLTFLLLFNEPYWATVWAWLLDYARLGVWWKDRRMWIPIDCAFLVDISLLFFPPSVNWKNGEIASQIPTCRHSIVLFFANRFVWTANN